jgi:hypothetical protein
VTRRMMKIVAFWLLLILSPRSLSGAAQEEKQPPDKTAATSQDATIYPVPNYGGDFRSRSYLTGDWGGVRSKTGGPGRAIRF